MRSQWCLYFSAASACSCECFGGFWERTVLTAVPVRHRNRGLHRPMAGRSHQRADARISCRCLLQEPSRSIGRRSSIVSSTISLHRCRRQGGSAMSGRIAYTIQSLLGKAPLAAALFSPFRHCSRQAVAKRLFGVEARVKGFLRRIEKLNQQHHLPVFHLPDSHFDFRDLASADVPSRFLEFPREFCLRPAAIAPDPPHLPTDGVLMFHTPPARSRSLWFLAALRLKGGLISG